MDFIFQEYEFEIMYKPWKLNVNIDGVTKSVVAKLYSTYDDVSENFAN